MTDIKGGNSGINKAGKNAKPSRDENGELISTHKSARSTGRKNPSPKNNKIKTPASASAFQGSDKLTKKTAGNKAKRTAGKTKPKIKAGAGEQDTKQDTAPPPQFIVGLGGSAGGLEAFGRLLKQLPQDTGMAFMVISHLDPNQPSILSELLARSTTLPVSVAKNEMTVEANHVYVMPPNVDMGIYHGRISLIKREQKTIRCLPVDYFLKSLARDQGSRAIGVILSGTASDGTLGLASIKENNGITFAQDPNTTDYKGMPQTAIHAGVVDFVGKPEDIADKLVSIGGHPYATLLHTEKHELAAEEMGDELNKIFLLIRNVTGADFSLYKRSTVNRRIMRRMVILKLTRLEDYVKYIQKNREEARMLFQDLLINVTSFFREPETYDVLRRKVFPRLAEIKHPDDPWRVWVPGCATGEEAYSLAISLLEYFEEAKINPPLQMFATDINELAIQRARKAIYPESTLEGITDLHRQRYFHALEGGYQVKQNVREMCVFATHDITRDPPFSQIDLVSFRNVLIYMDSVLQRQVIPVLHYAMHPWGFLVLGASESILGFSDLLNTVDKKHRIYSRKESITPTPFAFNRMKYPLTITGEKKPESLRGVPRKEPKKLDVISEADNMVLSAYAPAGIIVNDKLDIIQFRGNTGKYLTHPPGRASFNVLKMARQGLGIEINASVHQARKKKAAVHKSGIYLRADGEPLEIKLDVVPIKVPTEEEFFMILFEELKTPKPVKEEEAAKTPAKKTTASQVANKELKQLREELEAAKQYLQTVIEEKEQSNEELKAANEEIQSSNEELQSINEELETAKEELQSTNEELTTVNDELQNRNQELATVNDDLLNLLSGVDIPIIILDRNLKIRRFTPGAENALNMIASDIGRPITDINTGVDAREMEKIVFNSMNMMTIDKREVLGRTGTWYLMQTRPYQTAEKKIDGVIITYFDINELKHTLEHNKKAAKLSAALNDIDLGINSIHKIEDILSRVMKMGMKATGAEAAAVIMKNKKDWKIRFADGLSPDPAGQKISAKKLPLELQALQTRLPQVFTSGRQEVGKKSYFASKYGARSILVIPLMVRGKEVSGTVEFYYLSSAIEFDVNEINFARKLGASLSLGLDNALLLEKT